MSFLKRFLLFASWATSMTICFPRPSVAQSVFEICPPTNCRPYNCSMIRVKRMNKLPFSAMLFPKEINSGLYTDLTSDSGDRVFLFEPGAYEGPVYLVVGVVIDGRPVLASAEWTCGGSTPPIPPTPIPNPYTGPSVDLQKLVEPVLTGFSSSVNPSKKADAVKISAYYGKTLTSILQDSISCKTTKDFRDMNVLRLKTDLDVKSLNSLYPFFLPEVEREFQNSFGLFVVDLDSGDFPLRDRINDLCNAIAWAVYQGGVR
jgi:hypothetical protein